MPKHDSAYETKQRRKGADKARRTFELNGTYSAKHLRLRAAALEKMADERTASKPSEGDGTSIKLRRQKR